MAAEIFQLLGKIGLDGIEETHRAIDGVNNKAGTLGKAFNKAGQIALGVGKAVAVGVGAAATAVGAIVKASVDGYAEYEQLVGGVQTLFNETELSWEEYRDSVTKFGVSAEQAFKDWSNLTVGARKVMNNANQAFITAGLSANEYMTTVTSFSAGLLQSLGGDTVEAARIADMAIIDMADNANKMGTSMEAVQNAYQGFAKQNYTMLDNLKLGYGGTRSEMERLLRDATALTGVKYDINNLADVYEAIHVIQVEMGIAGATAEEAMTTIQGSANATKAAWKNLVVAFATDSEELEATVDNFVDSAVIMVGNIADRVQIILPKLTKGLQKLIKKLTPHLAKFIETMLPGLIEGASTLLVGLIEALPDILQIFLEQAPFILASIGEALIESFPILLETVKMLFGQIWNYVAESLFGVEGNFEETWAKIEEIFDETWAELEEIWNEIGLPIWNAIKEIVGGVRDTFEEYMPEIQDFVNYAFTEISTFWEEDLQPCLEAIATFIEETLAPIFVEVFSEIIMPVVLECFGAITNAWETSLKPLLEGITEFLNGVFTGDWKLGWDGIKKIAIGALELLNLAAEGPMGILRRLVEKTVEYIKGKFDFEWNLPRLKMPHISITGGFSLNPISVPKFNISWYKKAYDEAMVLNDPTIFGYSAESGKLLGGGEGNGNEVVAGESHLMEMIRSAVATQNEGVVYYLQTLVEMLAEYFPQIMQNMERELVLDTGVMVGELAAPLNLELGRISSRKDRGR